MLISDSHEKSKYSNVWIVAELLSGKVQPVTYELIGAARSLADIRSSQVWAVVLGHGLGEQAPSLFAFGADKVILVDDERLSGFNDEIEAGLMVRLIEKYQPEILIGAATARGRALIPRIAIKTNCGLTADCTELGIDPENGDLLQTRPAFGGNIMATIRCSNHRPQMATVRPRVMKALEPDNKRTGEIIQENIQASDAIKSKRVVEIFHSDKAAVNLGDAQIIISGGRGMKGPEGFELLRQLAAKVGGAVGGSRAAVDAGWIPYSYQVGQTGQTVQTKVYISCGISGQIQHLVGMQSCELIIAIDKKTDTPMMQIADIAIVGDLFEVIPEIIAKISAD
jgi:electron transfer flavoprotein alpha subunit